MADPEWDKQIRQAQVLISRLERISVDSYWAHRASGMRAALLRCIDRLDAHDYEINTAEVAYLDELLEGGYFILEEAARELRGKSY